MSLADLNPNTPGADDPVGQGDDELRALKAALQNCFGGPTSGGVPGLDGPIQNTSGTYPTAAEWTALFQAVEDLTGGLSGAATVPVGMIAMWGGTPDAVPAGWALCDGSDGTPDLRDRFIVGADTTTGAGKFGVGDRGGDAWEVGGNNGRMQNAAGGDGSGTATLNLPDHVIESSDLPAHEHHMFVPGSGTNTTYPGSGFAGYLAESHPSSDDRRYVFSEAASGPALEGKSGDVVGGSGGQNLTLEHAATDIEISGIVHQHDYAPRYYALAYIQYVGSTGE